MSDTAWTTLVEDRTRRIESLGAATTSAPSTAVSAAFLGSLRSRHRLVPHADAIEPDPSPPSPPSEPVPVIEPSPLGQPTSALAAVSARPWRTARREHPRHPSSVDAAGTTRSG